MHEILPVHESLRTVKAPFPHLRAGDEQGERRQLPGMGAVLDRVQILTNQLDPMPRRRPAEQDLAGVSHTETVCQMLVIGALEQDADVAPRMAMQGPVIVRAQEAVQIDVEPAVPRDDPLAQQVRVFLAADDEIGVPRGHDLFGGAEQGAEEEAGEFHG